ncbi:hypothetical protein CEB3_c13510 [Peptococcaceae bacterium CEB3]|nr:hypothetical protein CEB3_c13510 [Peptococcaceae bacterium CEB3]
MSQCWENTCRYCGMEKLYSGKHDAHYCKACDTWLEVNCHDPECEFCSNRPEKPSLAKKTELQF